MFHVTFHSSRVFKGLVETFHNLVENIEFQVTPNGISSIMMDSSHSLFIDLNLHCPAIGELICPKRPTTVAVRFSELRNALRGVTKEDTVSLCVRNTEDHSPLLVRYKSGHTTTAGKVVEFALPQVTILNSVLAFDIPESHYECECLLSTASLSQTSGILKGVGDRIMLTMTKEAMVFIAKGDAGLEASVEVCAEDNFKSSDFGLVVEEPYGETIRFVLFEKLAKGMANVPEASLALIQMGPEKPVAITFNVGTRGASGRVAYYIAPLMHDMEE